LPVFASIANVKTTSRTKDSDSAYSIEIDCGKKSEVKPASADFGTAIEVRDIFYKLPARQKFLRTANTELSHIAEHFTRIALSHCDLDLTLIHNGRQLHRFLSQTTRRQRIAQLFTNNIAENLMEIQSSEKQLEIFALSGLPSSSRANSKLQYTFLNGRYIRDKSITHAINQAYRGLLEPGRYPVIFLFINMPYDAYDVNVHPTKIEVRFANSNLVHSQVLASLREKLLSTNFEVNAKLPPVRPSTDVFTGDGDRKERIADAMAEFFKSNKPARSQQQFDFKSGAKAFQPSTKPLTSFDFAVPSNNGFIQIHDSYIIAQADEGFIIIDQHALHERIIYNNLCQKLSNEANEKLESQKMLIPQSLEITPAQSEAIKENSELIEKLGIELVDFGPKTIAVQALPAILAQADPVDFAHDLLDLLTEKGSSLDAEELFHEILDMTACKAAIKAGKKLTDAEIIQLLADKETSEKSSRCPHGRPTTIKFSLTDLEKQFKRT